MPKRPQHLIKILLGLALLLASVKFLVALIYPGTVLLLSFEQNGDDSSGNGYNSTVHGTPNYSSANPPPAEKLYSVSPTSGTYFEMAPAYNAAISGQLPWTFTFWEWRFDVRQPNNYIYCGNGGPTSDLPIVFAGDGTSDRIQFGTDSEFAQLMYDPGDLRGGWHNIACVAVSANSRKIYVDNNNVASDTRDGTHVAVTTVYVGKFISVNTGLSSWLDAVRVLNTAETSFPVNDITPTATLTASPTPSPTATATPSPTVTPSATPTPSASVVHRRRRR